MGKILRGVDHKPDQKPQHDQKKNTVNGQNFYCPDYMFHLTIPIFPFTTPILPPEFPTE